MNNFRFNPLSNRWEYVIAEKIVKVFTDKEMLEYDYNPPVNVDIDNVSGADEKSGPENTNENDSQQASNGSGDGEGGDAECNGEQAEAEAEGGGDTDPFWQTMAMLWTAEHGQSVADATLAATNRRAV